MKKFYVLLIILATAATFNGCKKVSENNSVGEDQLTQQQLKVLEDAGVDTVTKFEDLKLPDGTNMKKWMELNDPEFLNGNESRSSNSVSDKYTLFITRMTLIGFNLSTPSNFNYPGQPNGLAYVYGSHQYSKPSTGIANCSTILGHGSVCTQPMYGLDCGGLIYQMSIASHLSLVCNGTSVYAQVNTWNTAFNNSPDFQGLIMADSGALPSSRIQAGDIIVYPGIHIGMATSNGSEVINSLGLSNYTCAKNSDSQHGPHVTLNIASWLNQTFGNSYHVLRVTSPCGNVTDIDGNVYHTVRIGTQCWLQENLKTTRYRNGNAIGEVEDSATWANNYNTGSSTPAWCYYGENAANNATYGKLYNWYAVTDPRNVCPTGWHVPSDSEYTVLDNYLGGSDVSGGHMKAITLWQPPNTGADNSSGFTALPAGNRSSNGGFYFIGFYGFFWSSTGDGSYGAWSRGLYYSNVNDYRGDYGYGNGFSVRCVGD